MREGGEASGGVRTQRRTQGTGRGRARTSVRRRFGAGIRSALGEALGVGAKAAAGVRCVCTRR